MKGLTDTLAEKLDAMQKEGKASGSLVREVGEVQRMLREVQSTLEDAHKEA